MNKFKDINFRFAPDIFIRLGEELNPSPSNGIIELIRNSYDADASVCEVKFIYRNYINLIQISDNGIGMSLENIYRGWFILGKSGKTKEKTTLGRIPVGDKGLGRLAALRLGKEVFIQTRHEKDPDTLVSFNIIWSEYQNVETIEEINFKVKQEYSPGKSGTEITISDIRFDFGRREVKKLAREMVLLADPFGDDPSGFRPKLNAPGHKDLENLVLKRYFDQAELILTLNVDEYGKSTAKVTDYRGDILFEADHEDLRKSFEPYRCPSFEFNLWIYIVAGNKFIGRVVTMAQVKEWLAEFGGIYVYQNNIRIGPYGDKGFDWLELNLLRSKSPELMPSTNTSIGKVSIIDTSNQLVQKTDRSGFIENESFNEIKNACISSLKWMQKRRIDERDKQNKEERRKIEEESKKNKSSIEEEIDNLPKSQKLRFKRKFNEYEKKRNQKESKLKNEIQLNRTLSTAGIAAALFSHESANNPIQTIKRNIRTIKRRIADTVSGDKYADLFQNPIERILRSADALTVLSTFTLSIIEADKRRNRKVFIHRVINDVLKQFDLFLVSRKITYETVFDTGSPYFNGSVSSIEAVIANLLANSIQAFERASTKKRNILIKTVLLDGGYIEIHVLDNGPGITGISLDDIWLPGETTRKKGTGIGLAIVRDTIFDIGGTVEAIRRSELGGAEFIITIPIIGT